ncbi:hypothetical protein WMF37_30530 [Sorangium sp. So ce291]|uniref:hypothetical protein n=1 Tax=Sorangium sp. So ce291 TaxID=3133294 RepID=UPI003F6251FD
MKLDRGTRWLLALFAVSGCSGGAESSAGDPQHAGADADSTSCAARTPITCPEDVTYADVAPILEEQCVWCHGQSEDGPWPLTTYEEVAAWRHKIRSDILSCSMPPPDSGFELTADEASLILGWIRCGAPP